MDASEQLKYIIKQVKNIRLEKRISQMELSLRSGLSQGFITDLELGKKQPSLLTILRIAEALEVNPTTFFPGVAAPLNREQVKAQIKALLEWL
jgi:transcriptional regulator with XRE-family HTH domain